MRLLPFPLFLLATAHATTMDEAVATFRARRFAEAQAQFEQIVASEPGNAAAHYFAGMALRERGGPNALERAAVQLKRATELEPGNAEYWADFGGTELLLAQKTRSLAAARSGRDALEKAVALDPTDTDSRQVLFQFHLEAPWPLGSSAQARAQVAEIAKRDSRRAAALDAHLATEAKNYARAFRECEALLADNPDDYAALYEYGWCAARCGRNVDTAIRHLQRAAVLPPPYPAAPQPTLIWTLIGDLERRRGRGQEARKAYEKAVAIDPTNTEAATLAESR